MFGGWILFLVAQVDTRWEQVKHARCECVGIASTDVGHINTQVNHSIRNQADRGADTWATPKQTRARGYGDCEDIALLKRAALLEGGRRDRDVLFVLVRDQITRQDHAVLVVDGLVLDTHTSQLLSVDKVQDYTPLRAFTAQRGYGFGRRAS